MNATSVKQIVENPSNDVEICTLKVVKMPDSMKARDAFVEFGKDFKIIDVKVEEENNENGQTQGEAQDEEILHEFGTQGADVILRKAYEKNQINSIQSILQNMMNKSSCVRLKFDDSKTIYKLSEMQKRIGNSKTNADQLKKKIEELDQFLEEFRKMSRGDISAIQDEKFKRELEEGLKVSQNSMGSNKKGALVSCVGEVAVLKNTFKNRSLGRTAFVHYRGLRQHLHPSQIARLKTIASSKKSVACEKVEFGIFTPQKPDEYCCYWDSSKLGAIINEISLAFLQLTGKTSKKVQIIFDMPLLSKFMKIEFSFKLSEKIIMEQDQEKFNLYFELTYSPRFSVMGYSDLYYQNPLFCEQWERTPHFALDPEDDPLLNTYLTQFSVIKLTFAKKVPELEVFRKMVRSVGVEFESLPKRRFERGSIENAKPYLTYKKLMNSSLSYESKYAILACLTQKKINLFEIDQQFFDKLENKNYDAKVVEKTLKDIGNKNRKFAPSEKQKLIENFINFFEELYKENNKSKKQWEHAKDQDHMCKTKRVVITPTLIVYYTEEAELSNSILRRYKDHVGQFLRVTLSDEMGEGVKNMKYISETKFKKLIKNLPILGKTYTALAFSSSQLKNNSLWMFTEAPSNERDSLLSVRMIHNDIGDLSNIKNPAKYAARLGQLFSASFEALDIDNRVTVKVIDDITIETDGHKYNFSDGVGKISMSLLEQIKIKRKIRGVVSAIQIRSGGVKGILVGDPELKGKQIHFRPSMIKFEDSSFAKKLELLDYSKYRPGYLNRQIIILLLTNKLDHNILFGLQEENVQDLTKKETSDGNIFAYINNEHHLSPTKDLLRDCVDAEVEINKEPFVKGVVQTIRVRSFINLKEKCNILVKNSVRLTGVLDEYGLLNYGEIYLCISPSNGEDKSDFKHIVAEKIVITKNPCLHPGDIRVLKAVSTPELEERFKHLVNVVVFPSKGPRPHTDEISGSDLDGDMYFVSWDPRLIPPTVTNPMSYAGKKPQDREFTMEDVVDFFIEFSNNDVLGKIDNAHLALADMSPEMALSLDCQSLAELHAIAVDYAKTGVCPPIRQQLAKLFPDYMEKEAEMTFESTTILGDLYRLIKSEIETSGIRAAYRNGDHLNMEIKIDEDMVIDGFEEYLDHAFDALEVYYQDTVALINLYSIQTEYEIYSGNFLKFMAKGKSKKYNLEKLQEKMITHIEILQDKLREILFKDFESLEDFRVGDRFTDKVRKMASATYIASYFNGKNCDIDVVNEAMKNIGYEERNINLKRIHERQLIGLPWYIFKEVILEIKKENIKQKKDVGKEEGRNHKKVNKN